jgi:hypothetical protein
MIQLIEQKAVAQFVIEILEKSRLSWPSIYKNLNDTFKDKFVVKDETMAIYNLALAVIAQELQAVKNLFPEDQADRIKKWVYKGFDNDDLGKYSLNELEKYEEVFQKNIQSIMSDPLSAIPARLVQRWLGKNIQNFDFVIDGKKTGLIDPMLMMNVSTSLIRFAGTWKKIKDNYELIEGDIPIDYSFDDLKDYIPETEEKKPDGIIQYYDENGILKETWMPPDQINEFITKGNVKRVYKVLIKGPWDGIKEAMWEISNENVDRFVDQRGFAYVICYYEKSERKYSFVTKKMWEKSAEIAPLLVDSNYTSVQKKEMIKKILNK